MSADDTDGTSSVSRWLLYSIPIVVVFTIIVLTVIYNTYMKPHLKPHWLGAPL